MTERVSPRLSLTPLEWRLYLVAVLAGVYVIAWRAIAGSPPATTEVAATPPVTTPAAIWLDDLPVAHRPAVTIPPGWRLASRDQATAAPAPRVARVPVSRPVRVRTRSS